MEDFKNKICIVTLIGLPGSGKTYLTSLLVRHFTNLNYHFGYNVLPVTYDNYIKNINTLDGSWKKTRREILSSVKDHITKFKRNTSNINTVTNDSSKEKPLVIIIDDNMYYKSMRYEYFKLAKEFEVSFCQIYLKVTLELALKRNNERDFLVRVPEDTIKRMNQLIEDPDSNNQWERFTLIIPPLTTLEDTENINSIERLINAALKTPEKIKDLVDGNVVSSQKVTKTNLIHQVDVSLRVLVGLNIKEYKKSKGQVKEFARKLNETRLDILDKLRSNRLSLPKEIAEAVLERKDQLKIDLVHNYLQDLLLENH